MLTNTSICIDFFYTANFSKNVFSSNTFTCDRMQACSSIKLGRGDVQAQRVVWVRRTGPAIPPALIRSAFHPAAISCPIKQKQKAPRRALFS